MKLLLLLLLFNILVRGERWDLLGPSSCWTSGMAADTERLTNSQLILVMLACILFRHWPNTNPYIRMWQLMLINLIGFTKGGTILVLPGMWKWVLHKPLIRENILGRFASSPSHCFHSPPPLILPDKALVPIMCAPKRAPPWHSLTNECATHTGDSITDQHLSSGNACH